MVYCLDAQTGKISWTFSRDNGVLADTKSSSPTIVNGYVFVCSGSNSLFCLDALTEQEVWAFNITSLAPPVEGTKGSEIGSSSVSTSPAVVDDRVFVGGSNLYCLDANSGSLIWSYPAIVGCAPTVSEGEVYFSSSQGDAYCIKADTGEKVWNHSDIMGWSRSGPSVADGRVYFGGLIYCLNASNGEEIWHYSQGDIHAASAPIVAGQYAYFGARDPYKSWFSATFCVDAATGEYVWKSETYFASSPTVVDGVLYVGLVWGDSIVAFSDSLRIPTPVSIMVLTLVAICLVVVPAYVVNREGAGSQTKLKKVFTVPLTSVLIVSILVSSFASLCIINFTPSNEEPSSPEFPTASSLLWQTEIEDTASSMVVAYGKVFITAGWADAYAYNAQDGQFIWSWSGGYSYYYGGHVVKA